MEGGFPFYGEAVTVPAEALKQLDAGDAAVIEDTLMTQFGLQVGDPDPGGGGDVPIAGAAAEEIPGESPAVAMLAARVYLPLRALERTPWCRRGSLVRYRTYFKFSPGFRCGSLGPRPARAVSRAAVRLRHGGAAEARPRTSGWTTWNRF